MAPMDTRSQIAWLARRAGWGLAPGELDELEARGVDAWLDELTDPDAAGVAPVADPFAGIEDPGPRAEPGERQAVRLATFDAWLRLLLNARRPYENTLTWFWHDHFAVSIEVVQSVDLLIGHLELLRSSAFGSFPRLIRDVTVDAAMLVFLDGTTSTGRAPNENYARELLELYTMGVGNYTEDDVRAGAVALTGWVVRRRFGNEVVFVPSRHDDTPQRYLGVDGVHDVDTVVDAVMTHPAVPGFIAGKLARRILGGDVDQATVARLATTFADADLEIRPLARAVLEAGLEGAGGAVVLEPWVWLIQVLRATGARPDDRRLVAVLRAMGEVPGVPPNVAGYPGMSAWLSSSSTAGRFTAANVIALDVPDDAPVLDAAAARDWDRLADLLVRPEGFSDATRAALDSLPATADPGTRPGQAALTLALASPDLLVA